MKKNGKKPSATGLVVPAARMVPMGALNLAPYNPRHITPEKRMALRASVLKHGMVQNLVVQQRSKELGLDLVLIAGHQRLEAVGAVCVERGWDPPAELPCVVLDVDDATAKQMNVALNNIEGEFDAFRLGEVFSQIMPMMSPTDVLATGFTSEQIQELCRLNLSPEDQARLLEDGVGELEGFARSITLSVEFDTIAQRDAAKELLKRVAEDEGRRAGKVVLDAMKSYAASPTSQRKKRARAEGRRN